MKRWKKIAIGLVIALALLQIPFIVVRWQTGDLASRISSLDKDRISQPESDFHDYKGIIHAHSFLGGHSTGTFDQILEGASDNALDFLVMTEHVSDNFDTSSMTLSGLHGNTIFVSGNETKTKDGNRFLLIEGFAKLNQANKLNTPEFLEKVRSQDSLAMVTYPRKFKAWDSKIDGVEIFSLHTNAKSMNPATFLFDLVWSYPSYPGLTLARYFKRPDSNLIKYDELTKTDRLTLFAGTDAHSNLGFHFGDDSNNKLINLKFDRYSTIFRLVRTHVLIPNNKPFTKKRLLKALKAGNCFIGFDILGDSSGFSFTASNKKETKIQGDQIDLGDSPVKLKATAPQISRFVIFRNGKKVLESGQTTEINFEVKTKGTYRVEVYLDILRSPFDQIPWIISNPIYVR